MDQHNLSVPIHVNCYSPTSLVNPYALVSRKRSRATPVDSVGLTKDDFPDQYHFPACFLKRNFFEGGPPLSVYMAESLHLEGQEAAAKRESLAQDATAIMRVLEMIVMHSKVDPCFAKMLQNIADDYKGKLTALEEDHKKVLSVEDNELGKKDGQLEANA